MKKMIQKAMCVLGVVVCMMGTAVSAATVEFDVTPPGDPYSYSVRKADYEQKFYVTGTYFSKSGTLVCRSGKEGQGPSSNTASITSSRRSASAGYTTYAYPNQLYEMFSAATVNNLNVLGRYTP